MKQRVRLPIVMTLILVSIGSVSACNGTSDVGSDVLAVDSIESNQPAVEKPAGEVRDRVNERPGTPVKVSVEEEQSVKSPVGNDEEESPSEVAQKAPVPDVDKNGGS